MLAGGSWKTEEKVSVSMGELKGRVYKVETRSLPSPSGASVLENLLVRWVLKRQLKSMTWARGAVSRRQAALGLERKESDAGY